LTATQNDLANGSGSVEAVPRPIFEGLPGFFETALTAGSDHIGEGLSALIHLRRGAAYRPEAILKVLEDSGLSGILRILDKFPEPETESDECRCSRKARRSP
jgi:hypothetical protein